jgi:hypothetical protein
LTSNSKPDRAGLFACDPLKHPPPGLWFHSLWRKSHASARRSCASIQALQEVMAGNLVVALHVETMSSRSVHTDRSQDALPRTPDAQLSSAQATNREA